MKRHMAWRSGIGVGLKSSINEILQHCNFVYNVQTDVFSTHWNLLDFAKTKNHQPYL